MEAEVQEVNTEVGTKEGNDSVETTEEVSTFTKADLDREVTRALQTQQNKLIASNQEAIDKAVADALAEQKRLSELSEQEREEDARQKAKIELAEREAALNRKALVIDINEELVNQGLPKDTIDLVLGEDLESTKENIATLKALIDAQVKVEINKVVTTPGAPGKQNGESIITKEEIMNEPDTTKRQNLIQENLDLFK